MASVTELPTWRNKTFGPELADCAACEMRESCESRHVPAFIGPKYQRGGLMLVGEGPGVTEVSQGVPFIGRSGRLLDALLASAGIERDECWITNATLGLPPKVQGKARGFHERFPNAIYSCIPRLEAEIAAAQPRVIVTLGVPALIALTGYEVQHSKLQPFECEGGCDDKRKIGPALVCATGDCDWFELGATFADDPDKLADWATHTKATHEGKCPKCAANINRLRPRMMKCPTCGGRKTREHHFTTFAHDYTLVGREGAAGAVFRTETLSARLDAFGVKYVVPTYHPSFCLRPIKEGQRRIGGQFAAGAASMHLEKARSLLSREAVFDYSVRSTRDPAVVRSWLERRRGKRLATDIETNTHDGPWSVTKITCIGFATVDDPEALVVDTRQIGHWSEARPGSNAVALLDELQIVLEDPAYPKVWHNGSYDRVVIERLWGIRPEGTVGDTMLGHNACFPDEEHNLGFVAHELTDAPMWKEGHRKIAKGTHDDLSGYKTWDELADYNAKDDRLTAMVDERLVGPPGGKGLIDIEGSRAAYELDVQMQSIAIEMELNGLPLSKPALESIRYEYQGQIDEAIESMRDIVGDSDFMPTGQSLLWALYDPTGPLALPVPATTDTGKPSTKKDYLLKMTHEPFVQHLLRWRALTYHLSHYVLSEGLKVAEDGRVHPQWKVTGARTGRWSSSPNFQNWPKSMRKVVVAPPGRKIVGADYSQLEMRIMASLSGDAELIRRCAEADESDKLNPEKDPHAYTASLAFGRTYVDAYQRGDLARCDALRTVAKRVVYGLNYGAGPATVLAAIYDGGYEGPPLSIALIERVTGAYFNAFPKVPTWRQAQLRLAATTQRVQSPIVNRHRVFPLGDVDATVVYNYPIQSGAADIMSTRLLILHAELPKVDPTALLIAQVHDAIYVECDEAQADAVARCIERSLSVELSLAPGAPAMPYLASAAISDNWKDAA